MSKYTFAEWIIGEVNSAKCVLLSVYEHRDALIAVEGPQLEREYMEIFGEYEQAVIREEIECELLEEKKLMIQTAINRREPLNMELINQRIDERRQELFKDAAGDYDADNSNSLSLDETRKIQELYNEIIKEFHPQVRSDLTSIQKELYQKALEAYRHNDLDSMILIHDMIFSSVESEFGLQLSVGDVQLVPVSATENFLDDFSLVSEIFGSFDPSLEEVHAKQELEKYRKLIDTTLAEIEEIKKKFPYTAAEMLKNPDMIAEFKKELELRMQSARSRRTGLENEIELMTESVADING